jgi:hypothetical protein
MAVGSIRSTVSSFVGADRTDARTAPTDPGLPGVWRPDQRGVRGVVLG